MRRVAAIALLWAITCGLAGTNQVLRAERFAGSEEAAIRSVIVAMTESFNSHDAKAASVMYAADARLVTVRGEVMQGREAIERGLASIFSTRAKNASHRTIDVSIRFVRSDVALAHVTNELSGLVATDGQHLPPHQELSLRVFVKEETQWKVVAFHNTMIRPFGAPAR